MIRLGQAGLVVAAALLVGLTVRTVSLTPQVDQSFFFGDDDPQLKEDRRIHEIFPKQDQIIVNVEGEIGSPSYLARIERLTRGLASVSGVVTVKSLTHGPKDLEDAMGSEFWRRSLIPADAKSSNLILVLERNSPERAIRGIEAEVERAEAEGFRPVIAGIPYMIEQIRRRLLYDLRVFSLGAVAAFGAMILWIFRSPTILVGCLTAAAVATSLTLLVGRSLGVEIGLLTANLVTLVFVLTISHLIYLTYSWQRLSLDHPAKGTRGVAQAFWETLPGSCWSMGTTLLGFLSLLLVEAKPIRQLGASGAIGTIAALFAAYLVYPPFLLGAEPRASASGLAADGGRRRLAFRGADRWIAGGFAAVCLVLGLGILRLNVDPSLLTYFPAELRRGLERVDDTGGSSLMDIVVRDSAGRKLDSDEAYERLWETQRALERYRDVGTVIALPMLMAEGESFPLSFLFSWRTILDRMAEPRYERIARNFISYDHLYGHFVLRMKETSRTSARSQMIERIKQTFREHGFTPVLVGGMYPLQAQLAQLVGWSLVEGLAELVVLLGLIGAIVARSVRIGLVMALGMALVPIGLLGLIGFSRAPLDVISAPAANLALGMGIDDTMIHMVQRWRVLVKSGHGADEAWDVTRAELWRPVVVSMLVVCVGFSIFILSQFPPTRRFGLWVVLGTLLVLPSTLFFLPTVSRWWVRK